MFDKVFIKMLLTVVNCMKKPKIWIDTPFNFKFLESSDFSQKHEDILKLIDNFIKVNNFNYFLIIRTIITKLAKYKNSNKKYLECWNSNKYSNKKFK